MTKGYEKEEFVEELLKLLDNASQRKKYGEAGYRRVEDKFTAEKIVTEYEKVFEGVIGK